MNRTRGFVHLNRFKSGRAIKQLGKATDEQYKIKNKVKRRQDK